MTEHVTVHEASREPAHDFRDRDLRGARLRNVDLSGAFFRNVDLTGAVLRGVELNDVSIDGDLSHVVINGVDVVPLIRAELDRRCPDRVKMRPADPDGFREAWALLERLWGETLGRARALDPALLDASVDGEWSFLQTLRHLLFVTDSWVTRMLLGEPRPWDRLDLPWEEMTPDPRVTFDLDARPSLDEVLRLREERVATVRRVLADLTDERLTSDTEPVPGPGWPPPQAIPVRECLLVLFNEEWHHRLYAERDLAVLASR